MSSQMAANFWLSSHCTEWLKNAKDEDNNPEVRQRKEKNREIMLSDEEIKKLRIHMSTFISQLGRNLHVKVRQRVISTATVYLARFYYHNSYKDFHPHLIAATALYLASKVEESPVSHIVSALKELHQTKWPKEESYDIRDIVDAEYFLMEELRFNLIVFHPYRQTELYMKDAKLESCVHTAWQIINDSYRLDLCLYYPPHIIAIAVVQMAGAYHNYDTTEWLKTLKFRDGHEKAIPEVQEKLLELYEDYSHLEHDEIMHILDKVPRHPPLGKGASPVMSPPPVSTPG
ncbi:hypothetical protein GUITHDRAFT_110191 [Guillardia theta CCMP2712]|uniref:Cyclin-like domain-containing protein n=1 Tax=Guillardia theta (strain CCMP2712) TaxID=905079 RepID=L1J5E4_GUITC|nr:hypothetical protein GUITHDRAFT_110191 [Guillardia theta CCMP2712]EKX43736.1 hypothetical protein GUITHDRAFT_110191 [Guillardia theta CCMP2712]|eukprot:XP_005830716.1 hypothetical protein GUITHDRAFT_110191 [Guillardia theta CCMP2712]